MKRNILLLVILFVITACSRPLLDRSDSPTALPASPAAHQTGSFDGQITSSGVTRHYILHVPINYQTGKPVPLLINFHGYSSNSKQEENITAMSAKADRETFMVVYPDGLNAAWRDGPGADGQEDQQFVRDLISSLESQYSIEPRRIYVTGISNGGGMANRLGCDMADVIAAIAPDSGAYNFWQVCKPSRPIPVLAFHGLDDNIVPYAGGTPTSMEPPIPDWAAAWAARDKCNPAPATTTPTAGVTVQTWSNCAGDAEVILYTLANHGHSWPGSLLMPKAITSQAVNATDVMWAFFAAHPMP
jgi:polyhydroxybutyrate depolymerase